VKYRDSAVTRYLCKTAEPIEMQFVILSEVRSGNYLTDGGAHWRHLANTIEMSMCGAI